MEAGILRETITILSPPTVRNEYGEVTGAWTEVLTTRASFDPIIGREYFQAEQAQSQVEVKFRIRFRQGILPKYRVRHNGVEYDILNAVNVQGRNRELLMYCKQVTL